MGPLQKLETMQRKMSGAAKSSEAESPSLLYQDEEVLCKQREVRKNPRRNKSLHLAARGGSRHTSSLGLAAAGFVDETRSTPVTASFRRLASDADPGVRRRADFRHGC